MILRRYLIGLLTVTYLVRSSLFADFEDGDFSSNETTNSSYYATSDFEGDFSSNETTNSSYYATSDFKSEGGMDGDPSTKESPLSLSDLSSENIKEPSKAYPFVLSVDFDKVGKSKIKKGFFKEDEIEFSIVEAKAIAVFYYCPAYSEGANIGVNYTYTTFRWPNNPWFNQENFNTLTLRLGGFSKRLTRWFWQGQIGINIDATEWNLNEYATYDLILWGRYEYCRHIGIHIGLIAQTGMQMDRVYPIIGADWAMSRNWKLNLVYPVNISLEYVFAKSWSIALAGRNFNSRQRIHSHHESQSKSVIRYENVGAEVAIKYEIDNMAVNVHAGSTLGGRFKVANRHNDHPRHYRLDSAPYGGAEVAVKF